MQFYSAIAFIAFFPFIHYLFCIIGIEYITVGNGEIIIRINKKDGVGIFDSIYGIEMRNNDYGNSSNFGKLIIENNIIKSIASGYGGAMTYASGIRLRYNWYADYYIRNNTIDNSSAYNNGEFGIALAQAAFPAPTAI